MNLYDATVPVLTKLLRQVGRWLDKAIASAEQRQFDPEILLAARLAPDQYALLRQIQAACEQARVATAKLAGKEPPAQPDAERTILDLRARRREIVTAGSVAARNMAAAGWTRSPARRP